MPKLNLKVSVLSVDFFVIGCVHENDNGPTGVNKFNETPVELLTKFESSMESL